MVYDIKVETKERGVLVTEKMMQGWRQYRRYNELKPESLMLNIENRDHIKRAMGNMAGMSINISDIDPDDDINFYGVPVTFSKECPLDVCYIVIGDEPVARINLLPIIEIV